MQIQAHQVLFQRGRCHAVIQRFSQQFQAGIANAFQKGAGGACEVCNVAMAVARKGGAGMGFDLTEAAVHGRGQASCGVNSCTSRSFSTASTAPANPLMTLWSTCPMPPTRKLARLPSCPGAIR